MLHATAVMLHCVLRLVQGQSAESPANLTQSNIHGQMTSLLNQPPPKPKSATIPNRGQPAAIPGQPVGKNTTSPAGHPIQDTPYRTTNNADSHMQAILATKPALGTKMKCRTPRDILRPCCTWHVAAVEGPSQTQAVHKSMKHLRQGPSTQLATSCTGHYDSRHGCVSHKTHISNRI